MKILNINNFEEKLYYEKLDNKLEVFMLPMKNKNSFFALIGTKYGGENINFKVNGKIKTVPSGIAHFLEHKMFDTEGKNPFEFFGETGTDVNAYTTNDYTAFHFQGNNAFYKNLKYLLNWITSFTTTKDKVTKEQGIILEESRMYKDNPDSILYEKLKQNTLVKHPLRIKTIGTDEDILKIDKESLELCYKCFYRPDNMFICITGAFDVEKAIKIIKTELKDFNNPKEKIEKIEVNEPEDVFRKEEKINMNVKLPKVAYSIKQPEINFASLKLDKYIIDYYLYMIINIGLGLTSEFRESLLKDNLFTSLNYQIIDIKDYYLIEFVANTEEPNKLIKRLEKYLNKIIIDEESFERIKKTWIASEIRMIDNANATASNIIDDVIDYGKYKNNKIEDIKRLNYKTLLKVKERIAFNNNCKVIISNSSKNN